MTSIAPRSSSGPVTDDPSWIGSPHGMDTNRTVTLDISLFDAETHFPNGFIPSGTPLGKNSSTEMYGPYDDAATDGRETLVCFLVAPANTFPGETAPARITGAGYQHGPVIESRLPFPVDAAGTSDVAGQITFE